MREGNAWRKRWIQVVFYKNTKAPAIAEAFEVRFFNLTLDFATGLDSWEGTPTAA
jgi:hypothetical protein